MLGQQEISIPGLSAGARIWNVLDTEAQERKLQSLHDEAQAIIQAAETEHRDLSAEECQRFDAVVSEFKRLDAMLELSDRAGSISLGRKTTPTGPDRFEARGDVGSDRLYALQRNPGIQGRRCVDLFGPTTRRADSEFKSLHEFVSLVATGQFDPRLVRNTGMGETSGSDGGFFVPVQFAAELLDAALEQELCRPRCRVWPMTSESLTIASFKNSDNSGRSPYGGLAMQWVLPGSAGGALTPTKPTSQAVNFKAKKAGIVVPIDNELLSDAPTAETLLREALTQSIAWGLDEAFIGTGGNGAGTPLSVLNSPSLISVAKEGGQLADTLEGANFFNMMSRLHPSCVNSSIWLANSLCLPQMMTLNLAQDSVSFIPMTTADGNGNYSLLGRLLIFTEKLPVLGDKGDVLLVSFQQGYQIALRKDVTIDISSHLGFLADQVYIRLLVRCDGASTWPSAVTPLHGASQSWAVTLDERS